MLNIFTVFLSLLVFIFTLSEIIIFNEEIFLAACFITFVFVGYAHFNNLFTSAFQNRSDTFGFDLLSSFSWHFRILYQNSKYNQLSNYLVKISEDFATAKPFQLFFWVVFWGRYLGTAPIKNLTKIFLAEFKICAGCR
jgi:hypothetical protein